MDRTTLRERMVRYDIPFFSFFLVIRDPPLSTMLFRKFELDGVRDGSIFSIAALQLCNDAELNGTHGHGSLILTRKLFTRCFLAQFKETWDTTRRNL